MEKNLKTYMDDFDRTFNNLESIDSNWYNDQCFGVKAFCKKSNTKDANGYFSEEYIRARMVWSLIKSNMYDKENICVEFQIPKGNEGKSINPDIVVFKDRNWFQLYEEAKRTKNFSNIRKIMLVIFETKKNNKTVEDAIENQLRPAMNENESVDRIFGIYFDNQDGLLIFKKFGNSPITRFYEEKELHRVGLNSLNFQHRDTYLELPNYHQFIENNKSISEPEKLKLDYLDSIDETNFTDLMNEMKRANDSVRPKTPVNNLIVEFLTLKVFDEKRSKEKGQFLSFYIKSEEKRSDGLADKTFRERINQLYKDAKKEYENILSKPFFWYDTKLRPSDSNDERFLIAVVESFFRRAILKAKNESFNQIIFNNFGDEKQKADKGQFFTPIPLVKTIISMLNPKKSEEICDPCCGICDFPAMGFKHMYRNSENYPSISPNFFGFDLEAGNLKLAELNLVLNGDGGAILRHMNSLSQKYLENGNIIPEGTFTDKNFEIDTWEHKYNPDVVLKKFKIIATNPPFGQGRDLKTGKDGKWDLPESTMNLYETWKEKSKNKNGSYGKRPKSMDMGVLFLENAYKLLEDGGRMGIVLSNSIASIKAWESVREWFLQKMRIVALFDLPFNTFGETGTATTVIIAYKPKHDELTMLNEDYDVFVREIDNVGYEVREIQRTIQFVEKFKIDRVTFEKTNELDEDFTEMIQDFKEFLNTQPRAIKDAFGVE
ncbi:class I SAM-dependent DNA methyltransferase [Bacillus sp. EB600]|uniref:HsdM family class I SAM-dependent methyltransferase n=1 Tax=Bacillus sp. EB600 TaxID=2806345 RepID=UPI002109D9E1|nr:N-6 DNA methylase [Bacillus sp. EB600]MCQ6281604.1 N-6 DNA methylase [Bacillus sp. EB600]